MRQLLALALLVLLLALQAALYFLALLYRHVFFWIAIPVATATFYFLASRGRSPFEPLSLLASNSVAVLLAWDLATAAFVPPSERSLAALAWGLVLFMASDALCLGGAAVYRRAFPHFVKD